MSVKGNKNAEKWTEETVLAKLAEIEEVMHSNSCNYIGSALVKVGLYKQIWSDWVEKFKDVPTVSEPIKRITAYFEAKLFERGLDASVNTGMAIFGLKNNYSWTDRKDLNVSGELDNNVNLYLNSEGDEPETEGNTV